MLTYYIFTDQTTCKQQGTRDPCGYCTWSKARTCGEGQCRLVGFSGTSTVSVKINKGQPNKNKQRLFIRACFSKKVSHCHLCLVQTQNQAEQWKRFIVNKKRKLQVCLDWRSLVWGRYQQANQKGSILYDQGCIFGLSLIGRKLETGSEIREMFSY